ncbi:hypothetical protein RchiOBHm_Chr2g0125661 [Rosa chinensis]|uniref:Uncharacterized protein n=1 Tax=Rosa chinensis TaxID=74649 RepID=A0A2P6RTN3_ROSCH|nr:hypothetical protein RchiOBHm_Chr2g0125661 [Rosa chinensis]
MILRMSRMDLESFNSFEVHFVSLPLLLLCLARFLLAEVGKCAKVDFLVHFQASPSFPSMTRKT